MAPATVYALYYSCSEEASAVLRRLLQSRYRPRMIWIRGDPFDTPITNFLFSLEYLLANKVCYTEMEMMGRNTRN